MATFYDVTEIPDPYGATFYGASDMNEKPEVVGSSPIMGGEVLPLFWSTATGTIELAMSIPGQTITAWRPIAINDHRVIAGECEAAGGFRWEPSVPGGASGVASLLSFPAGFLEAAPRSINALGHVAGHVSEWSGVPFGSRAALWTSHDALFLLGDSDPAWGVESDATAINDYGQIAGWSTALHPMLSHGRAMLWQPTVTHATTGVGHDLGALLSGAASSAALGISRIGHVTGWWRGASPPASFRGFRWTPSSANGTSGKMKVIDPPVQGTDVECRAVNASGRVVGQYRSTSGGYRAMQFDGLALDLNQQIVALGWELQDAIAISDAGHILCRGAHGNRMQSCMLTPTSWRFIDFAFLSAITQVIFGVRDDGGGWVLPPGGRPRPVPPWIRELWDAFAPPVRHELRAMALRDRSALIRDAKAHQRLDALVPALRSQELQRALPPELRDDRDARG